MLEDYYRKRFDEPASAVLYHIKSALRLLQWFGLYSRTIDFLLLMESILEKRDPQESVRAKLLRVEDGTVVQVQAHSAERKPIDRGVIDAQTSFPHHFFPISVPE